MYQHRFRLLKSATYLPAPPRRGQATPRGRAPLRSAQSRGSAARRLVRSGWGGRVDKSSPVLCVRAWLSEWVDKSDPAVVLFVCPTTPTERGKSMGMDVYGKEPKSKTGEYFRNNVWWWRPLWDYCCEVGAEVISEELAEYGHYNDGAGLDAELSEALARVLLDELESGRTAEYERKHNEYLATLPRQECDLCGATGIRTDAVGVEMGQPTKELPAEVAILTGRTHGWCNGCNGVGTRENFGMSYPFSTENVREFADFLLACGGFAIC